MSRHKKWEEVADVLRGRIKEGRYKAGQEFPSSLELMNEFKVYAGTIQNAVNALIREGLLMTFGSGTKRRIVCPIPQRSVRRGGFLTEFKSRGRLEVLDLRIIKDYKNMPEDVKLELEPPVLLYRTIQMRDDLPVALSTSYIPGGLPIQELKKSLADPTMDLYVAMEELGLSPATCEESLTAALPDRKESEGLRLPFQGAIPVVRITRKVFDSDERLLELCYLKDRADCYEFVYRFQFKPESSLPWYLGEIKNGRSLNDMDFLCSLVDKNVVVLSDFGILITNKQKKDFIEYIRKNPDAIPKKETNLLEMPVAAHSEGDGPLELTPEYNEFLNISLRLSDAFQNYLSKKQSNK